MARAAHAYAGRVIDRVREILIFENDFVQVFNDEVHFPDGGNGRYLRIGPPQSRSPGVVILPVSGDRVGLVQSYRYPVGQEQWALPRGFGDPEDGTDPLRTAERELAEELGVRARSMKLLGWVTPDSGMLSTRAAIVVAEVVDDSANPADRREITAVRWEPVADLWRMAGSGAIEDGYTLSALTVAAGTGRLGGPAPD